MNFPSNYQNPTPVGRYNLVILGGGTAGLATALGAAELGAKVAVVEQTCLGGNQLLGMASKIALLREASQFAQVKKFGQTISFQTVLKKIEHSQKLLAETHTLEKYQSKSIDLYYGFGKFISASQIEVAGQTLEFSRAVIATGSRAASLKEVSDSKLLTMDTLHSLTELPNKLAVVGSQPIAYEIAQAFAILGSEVTLLGKPRLDEDAEKALRNMLIAEGVKFQSGEPLISNYDKIFSAEDRIPNLEGLNLEAVGVKTDDNGVEVNDGLRTTNHRIFAAGDVCSQHKSTQAAEAMGRIVIANSLFFSRHKVSALITPHCLYTSPQIAELGLNQNEAENFHCKTLTVKINELDWAALSGDSEGFLKIHYDHRGHIKGAIIVASQASEIIGEVVLAMQYKLKIWNLGSVLHPYPTQSEVIKKAGDAARRTLLTPTVANLLKKITEWRR